ncbi:sensor histidine kinase [Isoptericola hypogeus]|uniref:Sensor histidine kinase n=1 Tax=Isoptericola hypogeus TaxID=300179 RepID=A0ABN2JTE5_9MICO
MRRPGAETAAGLATLGVCVAILVLVPFFVEPVSFLVPVWAWGAGALAYVLVTAAAVLQPRDSGRAIAGVVAQTLLAGGLVIGVPGAGWLPILLVFGAATTTYLVPWWMTALVILANSLALGVSTVLAAGQRGDAVVPWEVVLGVGLYLLLQVASAFVSAALQREQRMRAELSVAHAELAAAAVLRDESSRASERLRIARELHDLLGHQLTVLTLELESATHRTGDEQAAHVARARGVARDLLGDVRATVGELRRRAPDLREALEAVAAAVPHPRVEVAVADDVSADEEQTAALVRVAQEAVTNAVRHAEGASVLRIEVAVADGALTLVAQDDGYAVGTVRPGHGLQGVTERLAALGGAVRFDGGAGFRLEASLPARVVS